MARVGFASYEIHPTTWGGAGVLIHHAAERLLAAGHDVVLLLDLPEAYFRRFEERDRLSLPAPNRCRAYHVDALCADLRWSEEEVGDPFLWKSLRFDHALDAVLAREPLDFVEFFEYCGVAQASLAAKLYGRRHQRSVLGLRVHNSVEWIDYHEATKPLDRSRQRLYGLEHAALAYAETVLVPSEEYSDAYCRDRYGLEDARRIVSEPPTVDFGRRPALPDEERDEVLYFGRLFEFKGVERFVAAALAFLARRPASPLRFVLMGPDGHDAPGGGRYGEYLQRLIPEPLRDRFDFPGHLAHEAARERFARARFAMFPNRFESFCYALHEVYDAGVPVIVSGIPAFGRYFRHEENALVVAGGTSDWVTAMERMADDAALRQRLTRPFQVAKDPLGAFYESPFAARPLAASARAGHAPRVCIAVWVPVGSDPAAERATFAALDACTEEGDVVWTIRECTGGAAAAALFTWLGRPAALEDRQGVARPPEEAQTLDASWVLLAGDVPDPQLLPLARHALASHSPLVAFAGSWSQDATGRLRAASFDVASELYPFEHGARLTRALLRTEPGTPLSDLFDPRLGDHGEVGQLWQAEDRYGRGCLLPEVLLVASALDAEAPRLDPGRLAFLVAQSDDSPRAARLARLAAIFDAERAGDGLPQPAISSHSLDDATRRARASLNGTTLLRLALEKLVAKLARRGQPPSEPR